MDWVEQWSCWRLLTCDFFPDEGLFTIGGWGIARGVLHGHQKTSTLSRLRRIEGQVAGIHRMVSEGRYCIDVLLQLAAIQGALGQVSKVMLTTHIDTCVRAAFEDGDQKKHDRMIEELMEVFSRYARVGPAKSR